MCEIIYIVEIQVLGRGCDSIYNRNDNTSNFFRLSAACGNGLQATDLEGSFSVIMQAATNNNLSSAEKISSLQVLSAAVSSSMTRSPKAMLVKKSFNALLRCFLKSSLSTRR